MKVKNRTRISKSNKQAHTLKTKYEYQSQIKKVYFEILISGAMSNTKLNVYKKVLQEV